MAERAPWLQATARTSWLQDAVRPSTCWWIIGSSVASFAAVAIAAALINPPAVAIAEDNFTLAAILAAAGIIVFVVGNGRPFGRAMQLATFVALATVGYGWYSGRQWTHARQSNFLHERQTQQIRLNAMQLSANLITFLRERRHFVPPPPAAATWDADEWAITRFERETVQQYEARFGREVRSAHDLLALRGLRDRDLDLAYRRPADEFQIQTIAIKLMTLARRLSQ
jgi:hypothetical protein